MSDPKVEAIRTLRNLSVAHWARPESRSAYRHLFREIAEGFDYLLTKLDEAEAGQIVCSHQNQQYLAMMRERAAAEERERTLIGGVKEALDKLERHAGAASWPTRNGKAFAAIWMAEAFAILSRLLTCTPTEEGKTDE